MKSHVAVSLLTLGAVLAIVAAAPETAADPETVDVVIVLRDGLSAEDRSQLDDDLRNNPAVRITAEFNSAFPGYAATLPAIDADRLRRDPRVDFIEEDAEVELPPLVTRGEDTLVPHDRLDQRGVPLDGRFETSLSGAGVHAYLIDTGIRASHAELVGRVGEGFSAVAGGADEDCLGHGTAVASVIAGRTVGVAPRASVHSIRVAKCGGIRVHKILQGLEHVAGHHLLPAVVNISLGTLGARRAVDRAVRGVREQGIPVVAAAGNKGGLFGTLAGDSCGLSPAREPEAITVAGAGVGADEADDGSFQGACVDLFGSMIAEVAGLGGDGVSELRLGSGTSFAAPQVVGVITLMLEADPSLTPDEISALVTTAATQDVLSGVEPGTPNRRAYAFFPQPHGTRPWRVGDVDGDGAADLLREARGRGAGVLLSDRERFVAQAGYWTSADGGELGYIVADFDGDGRVDLARRPRPTLTDPFPNRLEVFLARSQFFGFDGTWLEPADPGLEGWKAGDFDGDGRADLLRVVPATAGRSETEVFLSTGSQFESAGVWFAGDGGGAGWLVGDADGDGRDDVARTRGIEAEWLFSDGGSFGGDRMRVDLAPGVSEFRIGDFDGDGRSDILHYSVDQGCGHVAFGSPGTPIACVTQATPFEEGWYVGDFDGDGRDDAARSKRLQVGAQVFLSTGDQLVFAGDWAFEENDR